MYYINEHFNNIKFYIKLIDNNHLLILYEFFNMTFVMTGKKVNVSLNDDNKYENEEFYEQFIYLKHFYEYSFDYEYNNKQYICNYDKDENIFIVNNRREKILFFKNKLSFDIFDIQLSK